MYGGYTEGYPNIETSTTLLSNYSKESGRNNFTVSFNNSNLRTINLDFSDTAFDTSTTVDSRLFVNVFGMEVLSIS